MAHVMQPQRLMRVYAHGPSSTRVRGMFWMNVSPAFLSIASRRATIPMPKTSLSYGTLHLWTTAIRSEAHRLD